MNRISSNDAYVEVIVNQTRIITLKERMKVPAIISVGDPSIVDFTVLPNARQIRLLGQRIGVTDLAIVLADESTYHLEVHVVADLAPLELQLRATFPDASLKLSQLRGHVIVEGEARDTVQVTRILELVRAYMQSVLTGQIRRITSTQAPPGARRPPIPGPDEAPAAPPTPEQPTQFEAQVPLPIVINLIRIPGPHQVLLKVRVAELDRTAMRQIGADFLAVDHDTGAIVGTQIGGATVTGTATVLQRNLFGTAANQVSGQTTAFGIFEKGGFDIMFSALRKNSLVKVLAEPNLVALNGHQASFLAGGEFPVPVTQAGSAGFAPTVTVQFKEFGVRLGFVPFILDDDTIRLTVDPEVSQPDFNIAVTLVPGGSPTPGLNTRKAHTTVEMREGQTLAIAGLLFLEIDGTTTRIPGLGDLPILGPFFSNTTGMNQEKELIVLVTPYLVEPMHPGQVPPVPGDDYKEPNDLEFYLLHRIQGRTGREFRSTTEYDDALHVLRAFLKLDKTHVRGAHGYCD
jgi:pilus assembly protein CpaC